MNFFRNIFKGRRNKIERKESENFELIIEQLEERADVLSLKEREEYVTECLERMKESALKVEELSISYAEVTLHLTDIEELDRLPEDERNTLRECAKRILALKEDQKKPPARERKLSLTKKQVLAMEKLADEMPAPLDKMKDCEAYQELIKEDLKKLSSEKVAYMYRRDELNAMLYNTKGMAITCLIAFVICMIFLVFLQFGLEIDATIGYAISVMAVAISITILCVKHLEYKKEKKVVLNSYAKIVGLQNKVKIRFVNNTNLLEFFRIKYQCDSSKILEVLWNKYQEELRDQERFEQTKVELRFENKNMDKMFASYPIQDKLIWKSTSRIQALVDPREMVEIRHYYNTQRQKIREQILYNEDIANKMNEEIKEVAVKYPDSAKRVLEIVAMQKEHVSV